jgi:hypothetical protein
LFCGAEIFRCSRTHLTAWLARGTRVALRSFLSDSSSGEVENWSGTDDPARSRAFRQAVAWYRQSRARGRFDARARNRFFAGMAVGGFLFAYTDEPPLRMAANDIAAQASQPVPPIAR